MITDKHWASVAQWPEGIWVGFNDDNVTSDTHHTKEQAEAVCRALERDGLGGEGKVFPVRTWTKPIP